MNVLRKTLYANSEVNDAQAVVDFGVHRSLAVTQLLALNSLRKNVFSTSLLQVLNSDSWSSLHSQTLLGILEITHSLEDCTKMSALLKGKRLRRRKYKD